MKKKLLTQRDEKIDILRAIAMIGIIIAHSHPGALINQIRNFDVVLMVLLIGTSFYLSMESSPTKTSYISYLKKRFKRLVIPTWTFLVIFLALFFILSIILGDTFYFSAGNIIGFFTLMSSWYVWIIRVFVIIAILSPFLMQLTNKFKSNLFFMLALAGLYGLYMIFLLINDYFLYGTGMVQRLYEDCFLYAYGFGLIAWLGMRLKKFKLKEIFLLSLIFLP